MIMANKIDKDMTIGNIIKQYPNVIPTFIQCGMFCVSCPASQMETLEEAAAVHGIPVDKLLTALNDAVASEEA